MFQVINGRRYADPAAPCVVVCIDGSEPGYIEAAVEAGQAPFFARVLRQGTNRRGACAMPSFTNPNNLSIVTGVPPARHGICGNFFHDPETGADVMMNDPAFLRAPTLFPAFQQAGARIAVITAKDKLRRLLGHGLRVGPADGASVCFSAEKADEVTLAEHGLDDAIGLVGLPLASVYSAELSGFVMAAAVALMRRRRFDLMYLSTTDYVQHKHAPGSPAANAFYRLLDGYLGQFDAMGCVIALTADHGMNAKHGPDGEPNVIYLQDALDGTIGPGATRVVLPITDPYVVHHGALGSFALVYDAGGARPGAGAATAVAAALEGLPGIEAVLDRDSAAARFELPADRIGDWVAIADRHTVLGTSAAAHDLGGLDAPLRSHGGLSEQTVPILMNRPSTWPDERPLRNFDIFDLALNHARAAVPA